VLSLKRDSRGPSALCHLCNEPINRACEAIKIHYHKAHREVASVKMEYPAGGPNRRRAPADGVPLPTPSPTAQNSQREQSQDSEMAEGSDHQASRPEKGFYSGSAFSEGGLEPKTAEENPREATDLLEAEHDRCDSVEDEDDEGLWDNESLDSAGEYEEEMVVPNDFTLQGFSPLLEDEPSGDEGGVDPPRAQEEGEPSRDNVYGSNSKRPNP